MAKIVARSNGRLEQIISDIIDIKLDITGSKRCISIIPEQSVGEGVRIEIPTGYVVVPCSGALAVVKKETVK